MTPAGGVIFANKRAVQLGRYLGLLSVMHM